MEIQRETLKRNLELAFCQKFLCPFAYLFLQRGYPSNEGKDVSLQFVEGFAYLGYINSMTLILLYVNCKGGSD